MPVLIVIIIIMVRPDIKKPVGSEPVGLMDLKIKTY
jgi:hypothetical protein